MLLSRSLAVDPLIARIVYVTTRDSDDAGFFYKSADAGATWQKLGEYSIIEAFAVDPWDSNVLYVGNGGRILKSSDGGASWASSGSFNGFHIVALVADTRTPGVLYASDWTRGVFRSADGGASWTAIPGFGLAAGPVTCLAIDAENSNRLYGTVWGGFYSITISPAEP